MAKKVGQIRYYGVNDSKNYPASINHNALRYGTFFTNQNILITRFGIQTLPGVQFFINGTQTPILVGSTGIYELDVENISTITSISFSEVSLQMVEQSPIGYIIIDYVYDEGD